MSTPQPTVIKQYLAHLVDVVEGPEYTDNPADSGGPTKYGITLKTLAAYRGHEVTAADVKNLTRAEALAIFRANFVNGPGFGRVAGLDPDIALELIDTGVNCGPRIATQFLQRSLNVLNRCDRDWADIVVDGQCGDKTIAALGAFLTKRGPAGRSVLLVALNCLQGERYIALAERREKDERFVYGWLSQRVQLSPNIKAYVGVERRSHMTT